MIEERALVVAVDGGLPPLARVKTQRVSACQSCQLKSGCGQSSFAKLGGEKSIELILPNTLEVVTGDVVMIGIPENGLLMASVVMFLLPLICMVSLATSAQLIFQLADVYIALVGGVGLLLGFLLARRYSKSRESNPDFSPIMLRFMLKANTEAACVSRG